MGPRHYAKQLVFTIDGKIPTTAGRKNPYYTPGMGELVHVPRCSWISKQRAAYLERVKFVAQSAMAEQGWDITDKGIYMAVLIFVPVSHPKQDNLYGVSQKERLNQVCTTRTPAIKQIVDGIRGILAGVAYKDLRQIAGLFTVKIYDKNPRVEIVIGQPNNTKEMLYDLRNI